MEFSFFLVLVLCVMVGLSVYGAPMHTDLNPITYYTLKLKKPLTSASILI
jgi:hypothetical protein